MPESRTMANGQGEDNRNEYARVLDGATGKGWWLLMQKNNITYIDTCAIREKP